MTSVIIEPDQGPDHVYTTGEEICGTAHIDYDAYTVVDLVSIKLEGFATSSVRGSNGKDYKENHRLVYETQTLLESTQIGGTTLEGPEEYRFSLRFPEYNACHETNKGNGIFSGNRTASTLWHVQDALPPSHDVPYGRIHYFLKLTIVKHGIWRPNIREYCDVLFSPTPPDDLFNEASGRVCATRPGFFPSAHTGTNPLHFDAKVWLPNPLVLVCGEPLPLEISTQKFNDSSDCLFLDALTIRLVGTDTIRGQNLTGNGEVEYTLQNLNRMAEMVISGGSPTNTTKNVSPVFWQGVIISNDTVPSFATCNVSREYDLVIDLSFKAGRPGSTQSNAVSIRHSNRVILVYKRLHPGGENGTHALSGSSASNQESLSSTSSSLASSDSESEESDSDELESEKSDSDESSSGESESEKSDSDESGSGESESEESGSEESESESESESAVPSSDSRRPSSGEIQHQIDTPQAAISTQSERVSHSDEDLPLGDPPTYEDVMAEVFASSVHVGNDDDIEAYEYSRHRSTSVRTSSNPNSPINSPHDSAFSPHSPYMTEPSSRIPYSSARADAQARARQIEEDRRLAERLAREE